MNWHLSRKPSSSPLRPPYTQSRFAILGDPNDRGEIGRHPWRSSRRRAWRERHRRARGRSVESSLVGAADGDRESESRSAGGREVRDKNGRRMRAREENSRGWRRTTGDSRRRRKEEIEVAEERETWIC
ncbi:hypothetical protein TIFTF001_015574 [Ficus carica]|uniref:Uncharacterized protein n=1 Tax=Ficus carica TaxID=3494 RepID=A0AA88D593_FICCA|nr:hypothetical protein TIFTF001_015574 [Ficus carica]